MPAALAAQMDSHLTAARNTGLHPTGIGVFRTLRPITACHKNSKRKPPAQMRVSALLSVPWMRSANWREYDFGAGGSEDIVKAEQPLNTDDLQCSFLLVLVI
ncbi:hypothetical protein ANO14919_045910 [Xylariales sp. No.14919]|nr:hypothetical protein ANO14919_045910 [Xylariales sp. No.14919]